MVPLTYVDRHLVVGMTDPGNMAALDDLRFIVACKSIDVQLITETTFRRFLNTRFATALLMDSISGDSGLSSTDVGKGPAYESAGADELSDHTDESDDPPVVRLVNYLLLNAVDRRASDIHLEPYETFFRVRYRIDGRLFTVLTPPLRMHRPVVSRVKVISGMDIAVRRRPQDGHIMIKIGKEAIHFRVSTLPTTYGEKCVIRLLKKEAHLADLGRLGFRPDQLEEVKRAARLPQGLVLVTGPTGSGKTTTLHAMLNLINEPETNIVTVEDPVESAIPGINHVQVEGKGGVTFASALRSILRQDPDVVFVGEMRDEEVASIAIKAALTGHLVLSTLHTNGVVETFNQPHRHEARALPAGQQPTPGAGPAPDATPLRSLLRADSAAAQGGHGVQADQGADRRRPPPRGQGLQPLHENRLPRPGGRVRVHRAQPGDRGHPPPGR